MTDYCTILELDENNFSEKELKSAYRKFSKLYHPDANGGSVEFVEKFRAVQEAYEKLLILIKSGKFNKWKNTKRTNQQKSHSSEKRTDGDQKQSENHGKDKFSFYEFVNEGGLFEENFFEFEEKSFSMQKQHVLDDTIEVGSFSYRVTNFIFLKEFGNQIFQATSDGYFLIVNIDIQNVSKTMISIHNYMFRLFDTEGYFYEFSNEGISKMHLLQEKIIPFFGKEQNPRIKGSYRLIFEVPEIGDYFLQVCGGAYWFDENNICICNEIETIKLKMRAKSK